MRFSGMSMFEDVFVLTMILRSVSPSLSYSLARDDDGDVLSLSLSSQTNSLRVRLSER